MSGVPSARMLGFVSALPLVPGMRVLEIGCGPGVAARLAAERVGPEGGMVVAIDRSARAIDAARRGPGSNTLAFRHAAIEDFALEAGEAPFDLAFAMRVGALDGRHPEAGRVAAARLAACLAPGAPVFVDGGTPLRQIALAGLAGAAP